MLSVRTFLFGSDNGSSSSHLLKVRTAKVVGICWDSQGLTVDGQTRRLDGSNLGGDGGSEEPSEWVLLPGWMLKDLEPVSGWYHRDLPQFSGATLPVGCAVGLVRVGCQDLPCGLGPNCG